MIKCYLAPHSPLANATIQKDSRQHGKKSDLFSNIIYHKLESQDTSKLKTPFQLFIFSMRTHPSSSRPSSTHLEDLASKQYKTYGIHAITSGRTSPKKSTKSGSPLAQKSIHNILSTFTLHKESLLTTSIASCIGAGWELTPTNNKHSYLAKDLQPPNSPWHQHGRLEQILGITLPTTTLENTLEKNLEIRPPVQSKNLPMENSQPRALHMQRPSCSIMVQENALYAQVKKKHQTICSFDAPMHKIVGFYSPPISQTQTQGRRSQTLRAW